MLKKHYCTTCPMIYVRRETDDELVEFEKESVELKTSEIYRLF